MKTKLYSWNFFFFLYFFYSFNILGQTQDLQHQKTYWEYRDRFKKFYTNIGFGPGKSIPIENITYSYGSGEFPCDPEFKYTIHYHDATTFLGDYIGLLATEYKLLENANQDATSTLNELYYALLAVDRLDLLAYQYQGRLNCWNTNSAPNLNGFFMRDDIPANFHLNWQDIYDNSPPSQQDKRYNIRAMQGSAYSSNDQWTCIPQPSSYCNTDNEESQDQLIYLLQGLALVKHLVDDFEVQPTPADNPLNIVSELAIPIASRLTNHVIDQQSHFYLFIDPLALQIWMPIGSSFAFRYGGVAGTTVLSLSATLGLMLLVEPMVEVDNLNYTIGNPVYQNGIVHTGSLMQPFSYPLTKSVEYITGRTNFPDLEGTLKFDQNTPFPFQTSFTEPIGGLPMTVWEDFATTSFADAAMLEIPTSLGAFNYDASAELTFDEDYTRYMTLLMAAISGTWIATEIHNHAIEDASSYQYMLLPELLYAVLYNQPAFYSNISDYRSYLDNAPCEGPNEGDANGWNKTQRWSSPHEADDPVTKPKGYFNGVDYMLYYNLMRLAYEGSAPSGTFAPYQDNACPCDHNITFDGTSTTQGTSIPIPACAEIGSISSLSSGSIVLNPPFADYSSQGIATHKYLNHNLTVSSTGQLTTLTDLVICNNSTLEIQNTNGLIVGDGNTLGASIHVRSGSTLKIKANSTITVNDKSKIIVEPGGHFICEPNVYINLEGADAFMDVQDLNTVITLGNGEYLGAGASTLGSQGGVMQMTGGILTLNSGSSVSVNQSKLILKPDFIFDYHPGAMIRPYGAQSLIDVQNLNTNITLNNGDVFTIAPAFYNEGGELYLRGGLFKINDGGLISNSISNLHLGENMTLMYKDGASIWLCGDEAVLDIGGLLYIDANATFTFEYPNNTSGYLRFSFPGNPMLGYRNIGSPIGGHGRFEITGQNRNDKILEVAQLRLYDPANFTSQVGILDMFKINSGTVEIAQDCGMQLSGTCRFTNVKFTKTNDAVKWDALYFLGQQNITFINNEIDYATTGVYAVLNYFDNPMRIVNCDIRYCDYGVMVVGSGINIIESSITHCASGIFAEQISTLSYLRDNVISNNVQGIEIYDVSSAVHFDLVGNTISDNSFGGIEIENGTLNLRCNTLTGNETWPSIYGLNHATINMSVAENSSGYNDISGYDLNTITSIWTMEFEGASNLNLDLGYNNFAPINYCDQGANGNPLKSSINPYCWYLIQGDLLNPLCPDGILYANYNKWSDFGAVPMSGTISAPFGISYNPNACGNTINFQDLAPLSTATPCGAHDDQGACPDPLLCRTAPLIECISCNTISTASFQGVKLNDAIRNTISKYDLRSDTDTTHLASFTRLNEIAGAIVFPFANEEHRYLYDVNYRYLLRSFSHAVDYNQIVIDTPMTTFPTEVILAKNAILDRLNKYPLQSNYQEWLYANIDLAELYRRIQRHDLAINVYTAIYSDLNILDKPQIDRRLCFLEKENGLLKRQIDISSFLSQIETECREHGSASRVAFRPRSNENMNSEKEGKISLRPNPASSEIEISFKNLGVSLTSILIYDCFGKVTNEFNCVSNTIKIDVSRYSKGIYLVKAINGNDVLTSKFIVN